LIPFQLLIYNRAPIAVNELNKVLKEIRDRGITILFVEQNERRSLTEADRAYIMEAGRVIPGGDAAELREEEQVKKAYFGYVAMTVVGIDPILSLIIGMPLLFGKHHQHPVRVAVHQAGDNGFIFSPIKFFQIHSYDT